MDGAPLPRYRVKRALRLSPSGFLLDETNGESYSINKSGALILSALIGERGFEGACQDLATAYDLSEATARRDTFRFVSELTRLGLLVPDLDPLALPEAGKGDGEGKGEGRTGDA